MTEVIAGVEALAGRYRGFLVDQFGVLHDGERPFPGVVQALERLREAGCRVLLLSNSGRRSAANEARLTRLGISRELYEGLLSSGEVAWHGLKGGTSPLFADLQGPCLFISRHGDRSALEGLPVEAVASPSDARFVYLSGVDPDPAARARLRETLAAAAERGLPLLCTNPDLVSLEGAARVEGPGAFAQRYALAGGEVRYVGKPHEAIYRRALELLGLPPSSIVAVGDSLEHDIAGAAKVGVTGALVGTGVHAPVLADVTGQALDERLASLVAALATPAPAFYLPRFASALP